jgi:glycosyltransferase involved in cell wall biosynthesis
VLHVLESLAAGGMETTFLHLLRAMTAKDEAVKHEVLAFAGGPLEDDYSHAGAALYVTCDALAVEEILDGSYDVVHVLFDRCAYRLMPWLCGRMRSAVVYGKGYDRSGVYRVTEGFRWIADEAMLAASDGVTFTTPQLAAGFGMQPDRTTILRKAANVAEFFAVPPITNSTPNTIVCVANLHPLKRLGDLIGALSRVRRMVPDARLRLAGGGHPAEAARLAAFAAKLDLAASVDLVGATRDVAGELANARVFALPSGSEGVPTAILEAMAAGRPVVSTTVGHVASIVEDGVEGFLVRPGDVDALADRLMRILMDPDLARRMAAAGRARAADHDVSIVAADVLGALKRAGEANGASGARGVSGAGGASGGRGAAS